MSVKQNTTRVDDYELLFKAGDVIQDYCNPFIKILLSSQKGVRCDECFKTEVSAENHVLRRCSACKLMYYCDKKCQTQDWTNGHKLECKSAFFRQTATGTQNDSSSETLQFKYRILRLCAHLALHPDIPEKKVLTYDGSTRCFNDLMCHQDQLSRDEQIIDLCTEIDNKLKTEGNKFRTNVDFLIRLSGIFRTNAFCIYNEGKTEAIGSGIFIHTSVFDHSCKPTAFFVISADCRMQIRAIADIPKNQTPFVSYLLAHKRREERRRILRRRYNFECDCERCKWESEHALTHARAHVDYERLNELQKIGAESNDWQTLLDSHNEMIPMFRKIYHEYDERITNQFHWMFTRGIELGVKRIDLNDLGAQTENHLSITFGPDHHDYKKFKRLCEECS